MRITCAMILSVGVLAAWAAPAQTPRAFRVLSESNTEVAGLTPAGTLTWSNPAATGRFQVEQNFNLSTGQWFSFISGPATSTWHSLKLWDFNAPTGMVYVPAGDYVRGETYTRTNFSWRDYRSEPAHTTWVSALYMDRTEVTKQLWDEIQEWASTNGFIDLSPGWGGAQAVGTMIWTNYITNMSVVITNIGTNTVYGPAGPDHPVVMVTWYDMVKWCNARSLREGLTAPYYINANLTTLYRTGQVDLATNMVDWYCMGYRLPTEAEWEKAARGGLLSQHYPWPSTGENPFATIAGTMANYGNSGDAFEPGTTPAGYYNGSQIVTNELGQVLPAYDMANQHGLYDMAGNVGERCWDWYYYRYTWILTNAPPLVRDPIGPPTSIGPAQPYRLVRGGDWQFSPDLARCTTRDIFLPTSARMYLGFRTVRRPAEP